MGAVVPAVRWRGLAVGAVLIMAVLVTGLAWAFGSSLGSSPDDNFHQASIWCPSPIEDSGCEVGHDDKGNVTGAYVPSLVVNAPCYAFNNAEAGTCTRSFGDESLVLATHIDRGDYPGPYYRFMNVFVGNDVTRSVLVMRAFNVILATILLALVGAVASPENRRILSLVLPATFVPLGLFVIASVNPSSWALTGLTVTWLSLHTLFNAETRQRAVAAGALAFVGAVVASVARSDAGAYVALVAVAMTAINWRAAVARPLRLLLPVAALAVGAWSFLTSSQSGALATGLGTVANRGRWDVLFNNLMEVPGLLAGAFGLNWGLGWLDTKMPALTVVGVMVVVGGLVMIGLRNLDAGKVVALALVCGAAIALPLVILQGALNFVGENVQPRYVLPLVVALVGIALIGTRGEEPPGLRLGQTVVAWVLLTAANSAALHANIRRYVTGQDVVTFNLGQTAEWWWSFGPSPMETWALGSLGFAIAALAMFLVREKKKQLPGAGQPPAASSRDTEGRQAT